VIQPDLSRCGGVSVAKRVADLATRHGIDLVPHSWLTHLLTGYSLQLIATLPRARFVEFNVSQSALDPRHHAQPRSRSPPMARRDPRQPASASRSISTSSRRTGVN